jgi:penicillin-binding protein 2
MPMMVGQRAAGKDYRVRFGAMTGLVVAAMIVLSGRLYSLQISHGEEYREKSIDNFVKETRIPADRGMILDNRGRILVDSRPSYNVTLTPAFCQPAGAAKGYCLNELIPKLATYLSLDADESSRVVEQYRKARKLERFRDFTVKGDIDHDALDRLQANRLEFGGAVDVIAAPHRNYRYGPLAAHLLGYMNEISAEELAAFEAEGTPGYRLGDYVGRRGVERRFEKELKGVDGSFKTVVDAKGRKKPDNDYLLKDVERLAAQRPGHNLVLSVSLPLQQAAEKAFEKARAGSIVVVDVNTGFLLTVVSKPAYDPKKLTGRITRAELRAISEDPLEPLIFRAAQQHYHPGSTFKIVTALAGLESGAIVAGSTQVTCNGGYTLGRRRWRCHKDAGHGLVDLHHAISWSCDTFFYTAGDRMGIDPIAEMGHKLGFGRLPGLDLSPETAGVMPSTEYHNRVTPGGYTKGLALNTAIGQGDSNVSPLQMTMAYAAVANGGTLYKPQIVRRVVDGDGNLVRSADPIVVDKLEVTPAHLAALVDGLKAVVSEPGGTAYWRRLKDIPVAGKTGTAQVVALGERRIKEDQMEFFQRDHAWFAAFAPADKAEIAVVVLNEHGGHGGSHSAPAAMEVIQAYFRIKAEEEAARNGPPEPPPAPPPPSSPPTPRAPARAREARAGSPGRRPLLERSPGAGALKVAERLPWS